MSTTLFYHIPKNGEITAYSTLSQVLAAANQEGYIWINYCNPPIEELSKLIDPLKIHPLAIEDCTDENQIPKIDDYHDHSMILFNFFEYSHKSLTISEIDMLIGKNFLITVAGSELIHQQILNSLVPAINREMVTVKQGPAYLMHIILDHIVDHKFDAIEALEESLNHAEEAILDDISVFNPADLLNLRRELLAVRKSLFHEREIFVKICRNDCPYIPEKSLFFFRDIYDHLVKFFELTESYREIVTNLMEMYLSMINNQMAKSANTMNRTVRRLTYITTIFMPLSLLAGIGGMSEWSMMTGPANWPISYSLFLLGMVVIGIFNYYLLKRFEKKDLK